MPKIICHMIASVDGRLYPDRWTPGLENADIFFDVPLYVGLFGTVSAFLVMTFSPQSSRLIAYSSTLIGIIFSLILRLAMLWPLRQKLLCGNEIGECGK